MPRLPKIDPESVPGTVNEIVNETRARVTKLAKWLSEQGKLLLPHPFPENDEIERRIQETSAPLRESGMFPSEDGTPIYYEVRGEGRPLVLCYGLTCRREHWHYQIGPLSHRYRVILLDYRGHHRSGVPANEMNLTLSWCARDVRAVMNHLRLDEAVCLGHSMGVPVVSMVAGLEPERVKACVFICGAVSNPFEHMFFTDRLGTVHRASALLFDNAPELMGKVWGALTTHNPFSYFLTSRFGFNPQSARERDILMYMEGVNATPLTVFHRLLNDYVSKVSKEVVTQVICPTLVVAGDSDFITPIEVQQEMAELMPSSEFFPVSGGSHNAHMDSPEAVNERIFEFLKAIEYV